MIEQPPIRPGPALAALARCGGTLLTQPDEVAVAVASAASSADTPTASRRSGPRR